MSGNSRSGGVRALFFDVFGTVVDWRNGVANEARRILQPLGIEIDWLAFADEWRAGYQPAMTRVRDGHAPYEILDVLHRRNLDAFKHKFGLQALAEATLDELTLAWHRLDAWEDAKRAFPRLRERFLMAPVSNGNIAIMVDIARRNAILWDAVLGADIARDFKPKPRVYLAAAEAFGLAPSACMMVAAHSSDLRAAKQHGLMTAHVARPGEAPGMESAPAMPVDVAATSFDDLADKLALVS
jgi:2-haloacid dehalogenase